MFTNKSLLKTVYHLINLNEWPLTVQKCPDDFVNVKESRRHERD